MTLNRTSLLVMFAVTTFLFVGARSAQAGSYHHIDELALQLNAQTRELLHELDAHYLHKPGYAHLRDDAVQLQRLADHIHLIAHRRGAKQHLLEDLQAADRRFHHLEALVKRLNWSRAGHIDGDPRHVRRLVGQIKRTLHHLHDDLASLVGPAPGHGHPGHEGPGHSDHVGGGPVGHPRYTGRPSVGYRWGSGGIYYNGGRLVLRIQ